jgi:hypothetical protein
VIATRHHEHADQVVRALEAGKHVFVEPRRCRGAARSDRDCLSASLLRPCSG